MGALSATACAEGRPGRVWWLAPPGGSVAWILKRRSASWEAFVLRGLAGTGLRVPEVVAFWTARHSGMPQAGGDHGGSPVGERPANRAEAEAAAAAAGAGGAAPGQAPVMGGGEGGPRGPGDSGEDGEEGTLLLALIPGRSLLAWHAAGRSLPVNAWSEAFGQVHGPHTGTVAERWPPERRIPVRCAAAAEEWLRAWGARLAAPWPVDVAAMLGQALSELPVLGERADRWDMGGSTGRTLCHGDWTLANALASDDAGGGPLGLVDWECAHLGMAERDAAIATLDLFAHGWSARAALGLGETLLLPVATPGSGPRFAFWLVADATRGLVEALAPQAHPGEPSIPGGGAGRPGPRAWAAYLGQVLARTALYGP